MPTEVLATPRAEQQIGALSRKHSKVFENFLNDLAAGGCRALGRDKPPCCDETAELPPVLGDALTEILDRAAKLRKTRQSR